MAEEWRRVGLIMNPSAGSGVELALQAVRNTLSSIGAEEVLTGPGQTGSAAVSGWSGRVVVYDVGAVSGRDRTRALAKWVAGQNVAALVVVGGDGTLADVAQVCIEVGCRTPILGIGAGSTNVGRLVSCRASEAKQLHPDKLETWNVDCLNACVNDDLLGRAFNDVVIGYTVVGTIDGQVRDIDAAARLRGKLELGTPRPVATSKTRVTRSSKDGETVVAEGESIGTVIAGFAEPAFFGKAVSGGICLAALAGLPAGCLVSSLPLVQVQMSAAALLCAAPVISSYVTLSEEVSILVEKVRDDAVLCVDGNPLRLLKQSDRIVISVRKDAVRGVRVLKNPRSA
ncbi:MAG: diacylglycerol kinase family protein [Terriglobales bacterium]